MLFVDGFLMLLGAGISILGIVLWRKRKINWVSSHASVKEKDAAQFAKMNGIATIGFGLAMASPGLFDLLRLRIVGWVLFGVLLIAGMTLFFIAQSRYNS
jgi:hypothetical protein